MKKYNWVRGVDCERCGQNRCLVNADNEKMLYCFREQKVFFKKRPIKKKKGNDQLEFDFSGNDSHISALG